MAIFVGFDASTQGITATAIAIDGQARRVVFERALGYDEAMPQYGTRHGVLPSENAEVAEAPAAMWGDALDRIVAALSTSGLAVRDIRALAGSAQQHGTVYLSDEGLKGLAHLDPRQPLAAQMAGWFTREHSPIWMDSSTARECAEITRTVGGDAALAALTGSRAFERFAGPQIRRFAQTRPAAYARTARVHLISSFLASLLAGGEAPLEPGDASGMNLMDIAACDWAPATVRATADGLQDRLPRIVAAWTVVGTLARYWRERFGLPAADVVAWSGDNPCSLAGAGVIREGQFGLSLGTSDTVFGVMHAPRVDPSRTGHVFGTPTGEYMGLTCFRNGSLARQRVRDAFGLDWRGFSDLLRSTPPGNDGAMMLPWFEPEITPSVARAGVRVRNLAADDAGANVRAVVEGQALQMLRHSQWMGARIESVRAVGGASANRDILQVVADVFGATVCPPAVGNAAALGAALRAWHAHERAHGGNLSWDEVVGSFVESEPNTAVRPRAEHHATYARARDAYAGFEREELAR